MKIFNYLLRRIFSIWLLYRRSTTTIKISSVFKPWIIWVRWSHKKCWWKSCWSWSIIMQFVLLRLRPILTTLWSTFSIKWKISIYNTSKYSTKTKLQNYKKNHLKNVRTHSDPMTQQGYLNFLNLKNQMKTNNKLRLKWRLLISKILRQTSVKVSW